MAYDNRSVSPLKISEKSYNKQNRKMRKENPGMGKKLTSGTSPRRISFACRFGSMKGGMKDKDGIKTVDKLEATSASRLIDELREEEQHLIATRTTIEPKEEEKEE